MTCNNCNECNCNEQYEEFDADKEYQVGEFFRVYDEVFKVVNGGKEDCPNCDLPYSIRCEPKCTMYERKDVLDVEYILYDTLNSNE